MGSCAASAFRKSEIFKYKNSENVKHGSCVLLLSIASMSLKDDSQDEGEVLPPNSEVTGVATAITAASHGIEVAVEFKPVEHPSEPIDTDIPIQCPLPEPSILNVSSKLGVPSRMFCYTLQRVQVDVYVCVCLWHIVGLVCFG
ncbi:hypothetical protein CMV_009921 [Castanea mollissima]|uniref:Uncharacterized protein n=1 Tax=Castanea mollissima TaxID=60419 RepID=A0A8J4R4U2_9ROSI|nr:hypothetical protein CMV_009921 [Castanea mollissima]